MIQTERVDNGWLVHDKDTSMFCLVRHTPKGWKVDCYTTIDVYTTVYADEDSALTAARRELT